MERRAPRYFEQLNYTLANEDTAFELALLSEPVDHVVAIAGSGSRVVPLVGRARARVTCIDVAQPQLFLAELRIAAVRALDLAGYRAFLGYPPAPATGAERRRIFESLELSPEARAHWQAQFEALDYRSLLYDGRWERTFAKLARVNRFLTRSAGARLFDARTLADQKAYLANGFPHARFRRVLQILGNAAVFNALLYRGSFPRKNTPGSHFELYDEAFARLFDTTLARENFFLQLAFFGEIRFPEACPVEAQPEPFARAKEALSKVEVEYKLGDAIEQISRIGDPVDFVSLSDIASYFTGEREHSFLQEVRSAIRPGGRVVVRSYLHVPEGVDMAGYERDLAGLSTAAPVEKVGVYAFDVYRRREAAAGAIRP